MANPEPDPSHPLPKPETNALFVQVISRSQPATTDPIFVQVRHHNFFQFQPPRPIPACRTGTARDRFSCTSGYYPCDQNGGKHNIRLAVVHPFWGHLLKQRRSPRHRTLIAAIVASRQAAGLTQRQLAAKLKRSNSFVWKLEAGERQLNVLEFIEIARTLGVKASKLMAEIEN